MKTISNWLKKNLGFALGSGNLGDQLTEIIDDKVDTLSDAELNNLSVTQKIESDTAEFTDVKAATGEITSLESVSIESTNAEFTNLIADDLKIKDLDSSNLLTVLWDENDSLDRDLKLKVDSGDRTLEISGNSKINQDVTVESTPTFDSLNLNGLTPTMDTDPTGSDPKDLILKCGTEKTLEFETAVWDDMRVTPGSFDRPGSSDPTIQSVQPGGSGTGTWLYRFEKNNIASFVVQLPHHYKLGSNIYCHIHWTPGARGVAENGALVGWKVDYTWANINGDFGTMNTLDLSSACSGVDWRHELTPDIVISGAGITGVSSMLICNIKRIDTGADDTWAGSGTNSPFLLEIDFHYQIDTLGSRQRLIK